jgi:YHS domain-containing protein
MIRFLLFLLVFFLIYSSLKIVVRSAIKGYRDDEKGRSRQIMGDEMVLDPECHTYVVKDRAVTRHIHGSLIHFCSESCAQRYEGKNRA